ncbi:hypothetical protein M8J75_002835 [Diaphorina citri]|nr:hypothetical protein M8J75_002835 [Diaphorina citri]
MTSSGVGECRLGALLVWCGIFTTLAGAAHSAKDEFQHILRLPPGRLGSNNTFPIPVVSPLTPGSPCVPLSPYY